MRDPTLEEIAAVLDNARIRSGELRAACPAHGGEDANLSFRYEDGKPLARCHSHHCEFSEIMAAIRERMGHEETNGRVVNITHGKNKKKRVKSRQEWDVEGVARHVRTEYEDGTKDFSWRMPDGTWKLVGMGTSDLPLYGTSEALRKPDASVVVVEGEKAADALREAGICAIGTVTGAKETPGEAALAPFRGRTMILWPDNDEPGHIHMGKVAQGLDSIGADVRWFEWAEAVDKGDAADHPAILGSGDKASLIAQLEDAKRWSKPPPIEGRVLLGAAIHYGIELPEELVDDMLLVGKAHNLYAPGGIGKTWLLIWIASKLSKRGKKVVIFDLENGVRTYAERFEEMGADLTALDDNVFYFPFPSLDSESYQKMLEEESPDLVMFDSWIGFLAAGGRDENVSNDISAWADEYLKPALRRGTAIVLLDHVPHEHERERGSSRKRDEMDVVWKVTAVGEFDRQNTATLVMTRMKDREGVLPERLTFEVGGTEDGFVMHRDDKLLRTIDVTILTADEKNVLEVLKDSEGLRAAQWQRAVKEALDIPKGTFYRIKSALQEKKKVRQEGDVFHSISSVLFEDLDSGPPRSTEVHEPTGPVQNQGAPEEVHRSTPLKGGVEPGGPPLTAMSPESNSERSTQVHGPTEEGETNIERRKRLWKERISGGK